MIHRLGSGKQWRVEVRNTDRLVALSKLGAKQCVLIAIIYLGTKDKAEKLSWKAVILKRTWGYGG